MMEQDTLFLIYDRNGEVVASASPFPEMPSMAKAAHFAKDMVDISRQIKGQEMTECVEVWVRTDPRRMELLATFF